MAAGLGGKCASYSVARTAPMPVTIQPHCHGTAGAIDHTLLSRSSTTGKLNMKVPVRSPLVQMDAVNLRVGQPEYIAFDSDTSSSDSLHGLAQWMFTNENGNKCHMQ